MWCYKLKDLIRKHLSCLESSFPHEHVTSTLWELPWLPVPYRITYKHCLLMHLIHTVQAPSYLTDIVTQTATVSSRSRLRSATRLPYEQPRARLTLCQRAFSYAAPDAWNTLPKSLQQISDTETFKRHLKTSVLLNFLTSIFSFIVSIVLVTF